NGYKRIAVTTLSMALLLIAAAVSSNRALAQSRNLTVSNPATGFAIRTNDGGRTWERIDNAQRTQLDGSASIAMGSVACPNPTSATTMLHFTPMQPGTVRVTLHTMQGAEIAHVDQSMSAGEQAVTLDVSKLQSGAYYYRITGDGARSIGGLLI